MIFEYKVKNLKGETIEGTVEALNQEGAIEVLTNRKMIIISLVESGALPFWRRPVDIPFFNKVQPRDMVFLPRQLSVMVSAGLPLVTSLDVLSKQTSSPY